MDEQAMESKNVMDEELKRLRALVASFQMLNSTLDLDQVLDISLYKAVELLNAEMGSLALLNDTGDALQFLKSTDPNFSLLKTMTVPLSRGIAGYVARTGTSVRVEDTSIDERFYGEIDKKLHHETRTYLCAPLIVENSVIGTAQLMNRMDGKPFSLADEDLLNGFARQAALAIQNARLHKVKMKQQALDSELRVCNEIQTNLYPRKIPEFRGFELYGETVPCREVGGDYYTFVSATAGTMDVVLGDVSGKGVSAAMLVSEMHTGIHLLARMGYTPAEMVTRLNNHLVETIITGKFITFFMARLREGSNLIEYVDAGHPPPYLIKSGGELIELGTTGPIMGIGPFDYETKTIMMDPGDLLVIFSDAYSESQSPNGDLFGEERIADVAKRSRQLGMKEIAYNLKKAALDFRIGQPATDDATLVLVRRTTNNQ